MRSLALTFTLVALAAAPAPPAAAAPADDDDFEPDVLPRSIALGPVPGGHGNLTAEVGWLRSGARFDLGLIANLDFVLRVDTMLLYDQLDGQTGLHLGLRFTPVSEGAFRLSVEGFVGQILVPVGNSSETVDELGGELNLGALFELATVYSRLRVRGLGSSPGRSDLNSRQSEAGLGVERILGRFILGAEGFIWSRPRHKGLGEWRVRAALAF